MKSDEFSFVIKKLSENNVTNEELKNILEKLNGDIYKSIDVLIDNTQSLFKTY